MPDEQVDLHMLLRELREIKALLKEDLELDRRDLKLDEEDVALDESEVLIEKDLEHGQHLLEEETHKIAERTSTVAADLSGLRYVSLDVWRRMIWESCDAKRAEPHERDITYKCALYGGPCRFEVCPKNLAMRKKA
ncbi:TPA: hypothetical protein HA251_06235 [Candidatus Woesearchaeota archaeon]|nr:hypothetical protein [Candidatus Woesearchaeota archaeon]